VANFGVVVTAHARGVRAQPRVVRAGDENRLAGYTGLPLALNPYLESFELYEPVVGVIRPNAGSYDVVFDSVSPRDAGRFTFRFWIDDTTPPAIRLLRHVVASGSALRLALVDRGSGVDPGSIRVLVDGHRRRVSYLAGVSRATIAVRGLTRGRHRLLVAASDYQEAKNMEDVPRILPNTRRFAATFVVR
jgi:hypothetical protein